MSGEKLGDLFERQLNEFYINGSVESLIEFFILFDQVKTDNKIDSFFVKLGNFDFVSRCIREFRLLLDRYEFKERIISLINERKKSSKEVFSCLGSIFIYMLTYEKAEMKKMLKGSVRFIL